MSDRGIKMARHANAIEGFWERIEEAVSRSGLSKKQIAERGGFNRKDLSPATTNCMLSARNLAKFCAVTKTSADWLLGLSRKEEHAVCNDNL